MKKTIKEINADTWEKDVIAADKPVAVEFWHEQCVWCKRLMPLYEELSRGYGNAVFARLNVLSDDKNMEVARKYGISGTPTIKVFCKGREAGEVVGYMERDQLKEALDGIINKAEECVSKSTAM